MFLGWVQCTTNNSNKYVFKAFPFILGVYFSILTIIQNFLKAFPPNVIEFTKNSFSVINCAIFQNYF
jgi:hypothetical protein